MNLKRQTKRFLLGLFYHRLWVEIAALLLIIVTIPLLVMGGFLINTSQGAIRNAVLHEHKEIATRAAREIGLFIKNPLDIMVTTASMLSVVYPAPWKQETVLVEAALNQPIFMKISSADLDGNALASSELGKELSWLYHADVLEHIRKGRTYISKVKILDNHTPYLTMAVPIKKMGVVVGVLAADVNLRDIWDIVDNIRLGKTGRAFLVSDDGTLIAHEDKKRVLKNENLSNREDVKAVLNGDTKAIELQDEHGKGWVSSYAPIPGVGWGIILRQQQDEAYSISKVMKAQSEIVIALSLLMAVFVSIFMARTFVKPIKSLVSGTKSIATGDLNYKLGTRRRDEIGELIRSFNDMTEQLKRAKARERLSAIGEAASWIAHELKNSLIAIKSFVLLFPKKHNDKVFVDRFAKLIPDEIERWERMLRDLSGFSSQSELRMAVTDVKALIGNVLEMMREKFIEKKINVGYNPVVYNQRIPADAERLKQVFTNLFINAVSAMPEGGTLTVSLDFMSSRGLNSAGYIKIGIKDTGRGIPADALEKIFEPFHTTKKDGMGLGLAISRRIIQQHGGDIDVESEVGVGTAFIVRLPAKRGYEDKNNFS